MYVPRPQPILLLTLKFISTVAERSRRLTRWWCREPKAERRQLGGSPLWKPKPSPVTNHQSRSWFRTWCHWPTVMSDWLYLGWWKVSDHISGRSTSRSTFVECARTYVMGIPIFLSQVTTGPRSCTHTQKATTLKLWTAFYAVRFSLRCMYIYLSHKSKLTFVT